MSREQQKTIREYYGHGQGNRKVRIKRSGEVHYYGSTDATNRDHDWWHFGGMADEVLRMSETGRNHS